MENTPNITGSDNFSSSLWTPASQDWQPETHIIPPNPGVYKFLDTHGRVIYVGKAKNLRNRLTSYFVDPHYLHPRTATMITTARAVEWTIVQTEVEALQLEFNWIKEYDPRFNVRFKDDKSYPFLQVTTGEEFPRIGVYRGTLKPKVRYFGPYSHAWAARDTMNLLITAFPIRTCTNTVFRRHKLQGRPCLSGYIDKCSAPCVDKITPENYRTYVNNACAFLAGKTDPFITNLTQEMQAAAAVEKFEKAAQLRDSIISLEKTLEKQHVVLGKEVNADLISLYADNIDCSIEIFMIRGGRVRGQRNFIVPRPVFPHTPTDTNPINCTSPASSTQTSLAPQEPNPPTMFTHAQDQTDISITEMQTILEDFILQYYPQWIDHEQSMKTPIKVASATSPTTEQDIILDAGSNWGQTSFSPIPKNIYLPFALENQQSLTELLSDLRKSPVHIRIPHKGEKKALLQTVTLNAQQHLSRQNLQRIGDISARSAALNELMISLHLPQAPLRIECIDISHLQGTNVVASLVVFEDGIPQKKYYRHYKITYSAGDGYSNDVASIAEVTHRRFTHTQDLTSASSQPRFAYPPQLFIVDGGAPQVNAASEVLDQLGIDIPVIGIAKRLEQIWLPHQPYPHILPRNSPALFLLQYIRDEAHRFAISFHRQQRNKTSLQSTLDTIPGIGPNRRKLLIKQFGSLKKLQHASLNELMHIEGIGPHLGKTIYQHLHQADSNTSTDKNP